MNQPKNIIELRDQLCNVFSRVQVESNFVAMAHEASNAAGKVIKTLAVELDYAAHCEKQPKIKFLDE